MTANDISQRALDRVAAEVERRGAHVECQHADANALDAFEAGAFDLVSAQYASIPRTPDDRAVHNLLDAVAPGGTLLVVSHDLEPMRDPIDTHAHSRPFDPDAYVRVDDFAAALASSPDWDIEVHESATPAARGRLCLPPRRRRRAAGPAPRQLTRPRARSLDCPETPAGGQVPRLSRRRSRWPSCRAVSSIWCTRIHRRLTGPIPNDGTAAT